ncbi:hypothetical protein PG994_015112 [Apiospora phragmitis]|uniref:Rhodopsin domain-containing protein n=1 Tax=Apiospora phragmitis TaxID=2905665 RepID=A0ABR1SXC9_9PEZI
MGEVPDADVIVVAASWALAPLATISFGLRIWCRMFRVGVLWWDDLVLGISVLAIIMSAAFTTAMFRAGWSAEPVPHGRPVAFYLATGSCTAVAAGLGKTAYVMTLLRLTTEPWIRRVLCFFVVSLNMVLWLGALSSWARLCEESTSRLLGAAHSGGPYLPGRCWPQRYVVGAIAIATVYTGMIDLTLALAPRGIVRNLHMHKRHKIGISTSMSVSALAIGPLVMVIQSLLAEMPENNLACTLARNPVHPLRGRARGYRLFPTIPVLRAFFSKYDLKRT